MMVYVYVKKIEISGEIDDVWFLYPSPIADNAIRRRTVSDWKTVEKSSMEVTGKLVTRLPAVNWLTTRLIGWI